MTVMRNRHRTATAPKVVALPQLGPATAWPAEASRKRPDGDIMIRLLTAVVVLAVAAFAAVVSYSHIFDLGRLHGQDGTAARLLPLSVDGLIAAASLVMLHSARNRLPVPNLARFMLVLGVGATVGANVAYGLPYGVLGAVVSAWPAVAFVGSVEMAVKFVRDARYVATAATTETPAETVPVVAEPAVLEADSEPPEVAVQDGGESDKTSDKNPPRNRQQSTTRPRQNSAPKGRQKALKGRLLAADILSRQPHLTDEVVARRASVSTRTVERARRELAEATDGDGATVVQFKEASQ